MTRGSVAAGAGRKCAPAAPITRFARPLNFTVRRQAFHMSDRRPRLLAPSGLVIGAVLGMAGTFVR